MSGDLPHSVSQSTVRIMGVDVVVHHLNTGERIIEAEGMNALFEAMAAPDWRPAFDELQALAKIIRPSEARDAA